MKKAWHVFLKGLLKPRAHYYSVLPYNLNWQFNLSREERDFLNQNQILMCDVGARGSAPEELLPFFPYLSYYGFDADPQECDRLRSESHPYFSREIYPYFVGDTSGSTAFNLYVQRGLSSSLYPNERFVKAFSGESYSIEKQILVTTRTLDEIFAEEKLQSPDLLKIDTQGTELAILQNAQKLIKKVSLIELEVEFTEVYQGQPLFHDISKFLWETGFELLYLNRGFGQRQEVFTGTSRGQLIFGDALFCRREDFLSGYQAVRLVKYILLLINYGHIDVACHILDLFPEVAKEYPFLKSRIQKYAKNSPLMKTVVNQFDKLIAMLLYLRKHNRIANDSDRSWPFR